MTDLVMTCCVLCWTAMSKDLVHQYDTAINYFGPVAALWFDKDFAGGYRPFLDDCISQPNETARLHEQCIRELFRYVSGMLVMQELESRRHLGHHCFVCILCVPPPKC